MPSRKVTISLEYDELVWLEQRAKRLHAGNLSAAFAEGVQALRRREALLAFLHQSKAPRLSPEEVAAVMGEIQGIEIEAPKAPNGPRRRRSV